MEITCVHVCVCVCVHVCVCVCVCVLSLLFQVLRVSVMCVVSFGHMFKILKNKIFFLGFKILKNIFFFLGFQISITWIWLIKVS
jgi:hypothetical protein